MLIDRCCINRGMLTAYQLRIAEASSEKDTGCEIKLTRHSTQCKCRALQKCHVTLLSSQRHPDALFSQCFLLLCKTVYTEQAPKLNTCDG